MSKPLRVSMDMRLGDSGSADYDDLERLANHIYKIYHVTVEVHILHLAVGYRVYYRITGPLDNVHRVFRDWFKLRSFEQKPRKYARRQG